MSAYSTYACLCMEEPAVWQAFGSAKAVFVGKVGEGQSMNRMSGMIGAQTSDLTFKFAVSRGYLGFKAGETIDVHTGFGFGDCGFPFKKGAEYIVYADEDEGILKTGVGTRTSVIDRAREDIQQLLTILPSSGAQLTGRLTRYERSSLLGEPFVLLTRHSSLIQMSVS